MFRSHRLILGLVFGLITVLAGQTQTYRYSRVLEIPDLSFIHAVFTGLDVLEQLDFKPLKEKTIGVLCNQASVDRNRRHILELLQAQQDITVKIIFAPEFGLAGNASDKLKILGKEGFDPVTGARILELGRGSHYVTPPDWALDGLDLILVDIQDTGVRYSTYITTITKLIEAAAAWNIPMMVLDRPNPLRGDRVEGPVIRPSYQSFEGYHLVPIRHGLTIGEYVLMVNEMGWAKELARVDLTIIPLANWRRSMWYDETGLPWIAPRPDTPDPAHLLAYCGMNLLRGANLNVGFGMKAPYMMVGAPWIAGNRLLKRLQDERLKGVAFRAVRYTPGNTSLLNTVPQYTQQRSGGVIMEITDRNTFDPVATATTILVLVHQLYPREFQWIGDDYVDRLFGHGLLRTFVAQGKPPTYLPPQWMHDEIKFNEFRQTFLLYP